ncbi:MAG: hypothetical protein GOMPHAMPRED_002399 [Gomphillus americanus]|uniref:Uncharacterized protein n=1 Tax=Gomphillus americanus TaxID=1940652 RepID=A0A8H3FIW7_9LECA|nr:MAG: hypothetical protein GOMPHAMPRED_002399 [Gomphillus americanus]
MSSRPSTPEDGASASEYTVGQTVYYISPNDETKWKQGIIKEIEGSVYTVHGREYDEMVQCQLEDLRNVVD